MTDENKTYPHFSLRMESAIDDHILEEKIKEVKKETNKQFFSTNEVAEIFGVHEGTVRRWIHKDIIESVKSSDTQQAQHRIPSDEVDRLKKERGIK